MIDALQLRHEIIRPVLKHLHPEIPYSMAAENLLMGTCAQESHMGQFIVQLSGGPAKGPFQMEDATHDDINDEKGLFDNYLIYRGAINAKIDCLRITPTILGENHPLMMGGDDFDAMNLTGNLYYAAAMCRVHYYRVPMALPDEGSEEQMAHYWKLFYNTPEGAGTIEEFVKNYRLLVA